VPDFLPPVIEEFIANVAGYTDPLRDAISVAKDFRTANLEAIGSVRDLDAAMYASALAATGLASREENLADASAAVARESGTLALILREVRDSSADLTMQTALLAGMDERLAAIQRDVADSSADLMMQTQLLRASYSALNDQLTGTLVRLAATPAAAAAAGTAATGANARFRLLGTGIRLTTNTLHWMASGFAELAAVLVPASVAAAAWGFAWVQGATNVYQHMTALFGATEALGQAAGHTMGEVLGLNGAWQAAQNAANVNVYQAWGAALLVVRERFTNLAQTGLQVGRIFDGFMAKLVYDFSNAGSLGKTMDNVLSNMVPDLVKIGQLFGNLGHFLANFASQMPGLAEVLLGLVDWITRAAVAVTDFTEKIHLGSWTILTFGMAIEEFGRWGTVLVGILNKVGLASQDLGKKFWTMQRFTGVFRGIFLAIPNLIAGTVSMLGNLTMKLAPAGSAMEELGLRASVAGEEMRAAFAGLSTGWMIGITIGAAALGVLIYNLATARSTAQQFVDSLQATADKVSNLQIINTLAGDMGVLQARTDAANESIKRIGAAAVTTTGGVRTLHGNLRQAYIETDNARAAAATYTAGQQAMAQQIATVARHASYLASVYHTSYPGALALADAAGVKLNQTMTRQGWAIAQIKIASLVEGYKAMGTPMGVVGKDMQALAIQSGLAGSKVTQLNQAWDEFMSNLTSGTSGLGGFEESLAQIGDKAATTSHNLEYTTSFMSKSVRNFATDLTHYTGAGAQAWTNFNQVVGSTAPSLMDFLRTAGAEGAITGKQFTQAARDMVGQLLPLASKSRAATAELSGLAQEAGGPTTDNFKTLKDWVDKGHLSVAGLSNIIDTATEKMGNMAGVAQTLGNVLNNDIVQAMGAAEFKTSGVAQATLQYTQMLRNNTQNTQAGRDARATLIHDFELAGLSAQHARNMVKLLQSQISALHGKQVLIGVNYRVTQTGSAPAAGAAGGSGGGHLQVGPGPGALGATHSAVVPGIVIHVHGSVVATQDIARAVQTAVNQQTIRNGSTQLFIRGRLH
jgi:hypothetical protein